MNYRIYILDRHFHIMESHDFEGHDDVAALVEGMAFGAGSPVEAWPEDRLIACIGLDGDLPQDPQCYSGARGLSHAV